MENLFIDKSDVRLPNNLDNDYVVPIKDRNNDNSVVSVVNSESYGIAMYKAQKEIKRLQTIKALGL